VDQKDEDVLSELLLQWDEQGQVQSAEELGKDHPELVEELGKRIHALKSTAWLDRHLDDEDFELNHNLLTLEPRTLIGRYRLEKLVAEGGFAYVWLGYDEELQRPVAVKIPKPNRAFSLDSFMAEARRVARLKHPGIIQVHDTGRDSDSCFIVSEFVEGGTLTDQLNKNRPTTAQAIRWVIQIAEALEYAHLHGVIHRDIKPANILIDHHHRALLADFGIAQSASKSSEHALSMGTLAYVSPEQLEGKPTDPRSDVYSLGVVLHEVLTGNIPYSSREPNTLRKEIVSGAQSASELSEELKRICTKALQRDPQDRYRSAAHFGADLEKCLEKKSSTTLQWVALLGGLSAGVIGFSMWTNPRNPFASPRDLTVAESIDESWFASVAKLPAKEQVAAVAEKLFELNPGFNGDVKEIIEEGQVIEFEVVTDHITNIQPVRALTNLRTLRCYGTNTPHPNGRLTDLSPLRGLNLKELACDSNARLSDLSPLRGMPLTNLKCSIANIVDLSPLSGMPLTILNCGINPLSDLEPLRGLKLTTIHCMRTKIVDLGPLEGMPLEDVRCQIAPIKSIAPLKGAPLKYLECHKTEVSDLEPLRGMDTLDGLNIYATKVTDLSPLLETPNLKTLYCDFNLERDKPILRKIKSLRNINEAPAALFWQNLE
jgi:serine/threonine protein kinase